jgi:hypothetical protein
VQYESYCIAVQPPTNPCETNRVLDWRHSRAKIVSNALPQRFLPEVHTSILQNVAKSAVCRTLSSIDIPGVREHRQRQWHRDARSVTSKDYAKLIQSTSLTASELMKYQCANLLSCGAATIAPCTINHEATRDGALPSAHRCYECPPPTQSPPSITADDLRCPAIPRGSGGAYCSSTTVDIMQ